MNIDELDSVLTDIYGKLLKLRVENEVNKVIIHGLKDNLLRKEPGLISEVEDSISFVSEILEKQIRQQWSEQEANHFKELMEQEMKKITLLYPPSPHNKC